MKALRISIDQVRHVARLAMLELTDAEAEAYRGQLDRILEHIAELDGVDVTDVPPTFHPAAGACPLREDRVEPSLDRDEALRGAPRVEADGFAVPRVRS